MEYLAGGGRFENWRGKESSMMTNGAFCMFLPLRFDERAHQEGYSF